eukprot:CAMPEP_0194200300 /NCGR_PEP_ID=MMETSP0156-20130528/963_1 /TAXON_ID=33649 /ORGANISM="Thalassionema nitzschioides, Strain L26-B" /LENGTH=405 /DNA_ID=CAMNT_0038925275 /DNA_START=43 /DNA_END=1260 /DNA_ORIENTATION=+
MGRGFHATLVIIAAVGFVTLTLTNNNNNYFHRSLKSGQLQSPHFASRQRRAIAKLAHPNETITKKLSTAAHSYCDGNDLVDYPLPKYDACPPNSTLNVIPFFGGMTNALKFVVLGGLLSFEENRCFIVSEKDAHLNPGHKYGKTQDGEMGNFVDHFFEQIGLPHDHPFVKERMESGNYKVRDWQEYWTPLKERRTALHRFDYNTTMYSHPVPRVDGVTLKRDFIRHIWHLLPSYRNSTCQALKEKEIFDTDYIAMSIRRGDKTKEKFTSKFPTVGAYVVEADNLVPHVFKDGQRPTFFLATDDCYVVHIFRESRPEYTFVSQCDDLAENQNGYDILDIPKMNAQQREEHFRKFFIELYALALSKVFIGVAYTNVAWWAFMMRPADKETFLLIDESVQGQDALNYW